MFTYLHDCTVLGGVYAAGADYNELRTLAVLKMEFLIWKNLKGVVIVILRPS